MLRKGAETVIEQCLNIQEDETVALINDGNDKDLLDALMDVLEDKGVDYVYEEYEEPENHGEEPPERVAKLMKEKDVFIAPTTKSISHTAARNEACAYGSRGATLPGINKEVWNSSLQADYEEVNRICEKVYAELDEVTEIRVTTPSGTDVILEAEREFFHTDNGIIHENGDFGNLPAGEVDGGVSNVSGTIVIDHLPFADGEEGAVVEVRDSEVVSIKNVDSDSELEKVFEEVENSRNIAEFGFGTNPEAKLIGNLLQDEKVLGTIHIAFGDNASYFPEGHERRNTSDIHWDTVCKKPTVTFNGKKMLEDGKVVFE